MSDLDGVCGMSSDQPEFSCNDGGIAEWAGGGLAQRVSSMTHQVSHDARESEHMAAGGDLWAEGRALQRDRTFQGLVHEHLHLKHLHSEETCSEVPS